MFASCGDIYRRNLSRFSVTGVLFNTPGRVKFDAAKAYRSLNTVSPKIVSVGTIAGYRRACSREVTPYAIARLVYLFLHLAGSRRLALEADVRQKAEFILAS